MQFGGGMCSLCKSPGTNKSTCPLNADATNPNPLKHPLAAPVAVPKPPVAHVAVPKRAEPIANAPVFKPIIRGKIALPKRVEPIAPAVEINSRYKKLLKDKLYRIRDNNKTPYINKDHEINCTSGITPVDVSQNNFVKFNISTTYARPGNFLHFLNLPVEELWNPVKQTLNISIPYTKYSRLMVERLYKEIKFPTQAWISLNDDYLQSLSKYDLFTVIAFTNQSHWFITDRKGRMKTNLIAFDKNLYFPLFMQTLLIKAMENSEDLDTSMSPDTYKKIMSEAPHYDETFWTQAISLYNDDLIRIIRLSPPVEKEFMVYRGVTTQYLRLGKSNLTTLEQHMSTSLCPYHAIEYMRGSSCCLARILVTVGSKVLFVEGLSFYSNEYECILPKTARIDIIAVQNILLPRNKYIDPCFTNLHSIMVIDMVYRGFS